MAYKANILLGHITRTHGFEGAVTIRLEKTFVENIPEMESVFLIIEGKPVPFLISSAEYPGGDILWLKFDGYESVQRVREFTGTKVYLISAVTDDIQDDNTDLLKGFKVRTTDNKVIGTITGLIENPGQILLNLQTENGRELLIPYHENLVIKADRVNRTLLMDLPEGLTDLNPK